jgi:hypothetical protein
LPTKNHTSRPQKGRKGTKIIDNFLIAVVCPQNLPQESQYYSMKNHLQPICKIPKETGVIETSKSLAEFFCNLFGEWGKIVPLHS